MWAEGRCLRDITVAEIPREVVSAPSLALEEQDSREPAVLRRPIAAVMNPAAGGGGVGRSRLRIRRQIEARLGEVTIYETTARGDGERLAAQAVRAGASTVLSLGGDGTHSEVTNGVLSASGGRVSLGALPGGTGGDFLRTTGAPGSIDAALAALAEASVMPVDVGHARVIGVDGFERERWFLNGVSFGISGLVCQLANRSLKALGPRLTYLTAIGAALRRYRPTAVRLWLDGVALDPVPITCVFVFNGRYGAGGMPFAPEARLDDGMLDVLVLRSGPALETVGMIRDVYRGTHVHHRRVDAYRAKEIIAEPVGDAPVFVDADGELLGRLPLHITLQPGALPLLVPPGLARCA